MSDLSPNSIHRSPITVTIGVAVRYENPSKLKPFVSQLTRAAQHLDQIADTEVCFCINGASDETESFLSEVVAGFSHHELRFICCRSSPGKIQAHTAIAHCRELKGALIFVDADVDLGEDTFTRLHEFMTFEPEVMACYAEVIAQPSVAKGWLRSLQDAYYQSRHHLPPRRHLHSRCFMLRQWLPDFLPEQERSVVTHRRLSSRRALFLALDKGPIIDDIHYSRVLTHRFGWNAIACVANASVGFEPPPSIADLFRSLYRTELELQRLDYLFPEHHQTEAFFTPLRKRTKVLRMAKSAGVSAGAYVFLESVVRTLARWSVKIGFKPRWRSRVNDHHDNCER